MSALRRRIGRIMIVALAAGLAGYGLAKLYIWSQARRGIEDLARLAAPYASIEWDSVSAGLDAQMQIRELTIKPRMLNDTISVKSLIIKLPAGFRPEELMHRFMTGELSGALRINAQGIAIRTDGPLFQQLNQITDGYLWRTPLAALGCEGIEKLDRAILTRPSGNLVHANVALRLRIYSPPRRLALSLDIDLQELAATGLEATMDLDRPVFSLQNPVTLTTLPLSVTGLRIRHTDRGFNANRNLLCAGAQDMPVAAFLDRHLAAVRAIYLERQPVPSDEVFIQYRDFATHGGEILIDLNFNKPMAPAELYRMDKQQLLTHAQLAINGASIDNPAVVWSPWISDNRGRFPAVQKTASAAPFKAQPSFHEVPVTDLIHHLGERTRLITRDGSHHKGILEKIDADSVTLRWELNGGYMRFSIAADKVKEAQIYR